MGLVGRLVLGEPDVAVGTEQLRRAELRLQGGGQRGHRRLHRRVVDLLVRGPEGLGVVHLEVVVEVEGRDGEPVEGHVGSVHAAKDSSAGQPRNRVAGSSASTQATRSAKLRLSGGSAPTGNQRTSVRLVVGGVRLPRDVGAGEGVVEVGRPVAVRRGSWAAAPAPRRAGRR